jgi:hypothetical protein
MLNKIVTIAGDLLSPSPALFFQLNQERLLRYQTRLVELAAALETLRNEAFAAAARLMAIDPEPVARLRSYTDIASDGGGL